MASGDLRQHAIHYFSDLIQDGVAKPIFSETSQIGLGQLRANRHPLINNGFGKIPDSLCRNSEFAEDPFGQKSGICFLQPLTKD